MCYSKSFTNITEKKKTTREIAIGDRTIINAYFNLLFFWGGGDNGKTGYYSQCNTKTSNSFSCLLHSMNFMIKPKQHTCKEHFTSYALKQKLMSGGELLINSTEFISCCHLM